MNRHFSALFGAMVKGCESPAADLPAAMRALPPVGSLPSPWTTWLIIAIFQYRQRQQWAKDLLRTHLPKAIPPRKEIRRRVQPVEFVLPEIPEWQVSLECAYEFAQMVHRVTGKSSLPA